MRLVTVKYGQQQDRIPEIWLVGASSSYQRKGLDPRDAYYQAISDWFEQKRLEAEWAAQKAKNALSGQETSGNGVADKVDDVPLSTKGS